MKILESYLGVAPRGCRQFLMAGPLWTKYQLGMDRGVSEPLGGYQARVLYREHRE